MRLHDRYVLKMFFSTFAAVLFFFTAIVVVIDLADGMMKFSRQWDAVRELGYNPGLLLLEYYATLVPFIWLRIMPFAVAIAAAFSLARLGRHNELDALIVGGVSQRRAVLPILAAGVMATGVMLAVQEDAVAPIARRHAVLQRIMEKKSPDRVSRVPHMRDPTGATVAMNAFLPLAQKMEAVWIGRWGKEGLDEVYWYPELAWDASTEAWVASQGGERIPYVGAPTGAVREGIAVGAEAPLLLSLAFVESAIGAAEMAVRSSREARALMAAHPDDVRPVVAYHQSLAASVSTISLLLLVFPFAMRIGHRKKSSLPGMAAALALGGASFAASYVGGNVATMGVWNPVVVAWLPTILFGSLGGALYLTLDS